MKVAAGDFGCSVYLRGEEGEESGGEAALDAACGVSGEHWGEVARGARRGLVVESGSAQHVDVTRTVGKIQLWTVVSAYARMFAGTAPRLVQVVPAPGQERAKAYEGKEVGGAGLQVGCGWS
ncbi:hypothetical protein HDU93_008497 [Gonapodya sp. JEL0774]|nr:hypothetical protein HDU93_008497 [Gonapodya sp. JEL0774]